MIKTPIGKLGSGQIVFDREPSHIHTGVTPELLGQALTQVFAEPNEVRVKRSINFGHVIGVSACVETSESDQIIFAQRVHRDGLTRFVKNRQPQETSLLTASMRLQPDGRYQLGTAYIGSPGVNEYWATENSEELKAAIEFWNGHALVWGSEPIVSGTETAARPW